MDGAAVPSGRRRFALAVAARPDQFQPPSQLQPNRQVLELDRPPVKLRKAAGHRPAPAGNVIGQGLDSTPGSSVSLEGVAATWGSAPRQARSKPQVGRWPPPAREALTIDAVPQN